MLDHDELPDDIEVEDAIKRLDRDFGPWRASLSAAQIAELRAYQGIGYWRINSILRESAEAAAFDEETLRKVDLSLEAIDSAIAAGRLDDTVRVYRGLRDAPSVLGVEDLDTLVGRPVGDRAYVSTSIDPEVADRIASPSQDGIVIEIRLEAGQAAAWLPLAGEKARRSEAELLLPRRTQVLVEGVARGAGTPMIRSTVVV